MNTNIKVITSDIFLDKNVEFFAKEKSTWNYILYTLTHNFEIIKVDTPSFNIEEETKQVITYKIESKIPEDIITELDEILEKDENREKVYIYEISKIQMVDNFYYTIRIY